MGKEVNSVNKAYTENVICIEAVEGGGTNVNPF